MSSRHWGFLSTEVSLENKVATNKNSSQYSQNPQSTSVFRSTWKLYKPYPIWYHVPSPGFKIINKISYLSFKCIMRCCSKMITLEKNKWSEMEKHLILVNFYVLKHSKVTILGKLTRLFRIRLLNINCSNFSYHAGEASFLACIIAVVNTKLEIELAGWIRLSFVATKTNSRDLDILPCK